MRLRAARHAIACLALVGLARDAGAVSRYVVRIHSGTWVGRAAAVQLDYVSADTVSNRVDLLEFDGDGRRRPAIAHAYPLQGNLGLVPVAHPAAAAFGNRLFRSWLTVPFDSLGRGIQFVLQVSEARGLPDRPPDMLTFSIATPESAAMLATADPLAANALFTLEVSGDDGGRLSVYPPARLVEPDTIDIVLPRTARPPAARPRR
jgi:hypothetical protein